MSQMMNIGRMDRHHSVKEPIDAGSPYVNAQSFSPARVETGLTKTIQASNEKGANAADFSARLSTAVNEGQSQQASRLKEMNVETETAATAGSALTPDNTAPAQLDDPSERLPSPYTGDDNQQDSRNDSDDKSDTEDEQVQHVLSQLSLATRLKQGESDVVVSSIDEDANKEKVSTDSVSDKSGLFVTSSVTSSRGEQHKEASQSVSQLAILGKSDQTIKAEDNALKNDKLNDIAQAKKALKDSAEKTDLMSETSSDNKARTHSAQLSQNSNNMTAMMGDDVNTKVNFSVNLDSNSHSNIHLNISTPMHLADPMNGPLASSSASSTAVKMSLKSAGDNLSSMQNMIKRFSPVMQQQLLTMVGQGIQQAEIRLDPAELGQMMVKIQVQGDTTQVQFQVTQQQTRELIEQALPRLKEMLAEQGMQLSDGQVSYQHAQQDAQNGGQNEPQQEEAQSGNHSSMDNLALTETHVIDIAMNEDAGLDSHGGVSSISGIDYYA